MTQVYDCPGRTNKDSISPCLEHILDGKQRSVLKNARRRALGKTAAIRCRRVFNARDYLAN